MLPKIFGAAAAVLLACTAVILSYFLFFAKPKPEFRMANFPTELSKDVVATVNGYERREMDGELTKYIVRADKAVSYSDNHQELENVFLEVFSDDGAASDKISAKKAVYIPAENKNFTAYFAGTVGVETRDQLRVKTEQLTYVKETELATAEELVQFERLNIKGKSLGATVFVREKRLRLPKDVEIEAIGGDGRENGRLIASSAEYDQGGEKIDLNGSVAIALVSGEERKTDLAASRAVVFLTDGSGEGTTVESKSVKQAELFDGVKISTAAAGQSTNIAAGYALYDKPADKFELKDAVHIVTSEGAQPTETRSDQAVYEQAQGRIDLNGNASVTQGTSLVQGNSIYAELDAAKKVRMSDVRDNALVRQTAADRTTEVTGPHLKALFGDDHSLTKANVFGPGSAVLVPAKPVEYTRLSMIAGRSIDVDFKGDGLLNRITTEGRTNVKVDVPNNTADAANKSLTADSVTTNFNSTGKDIATATAKGNAELVVEPLNASDQNYKTTVNAPQFDCEFFPVGNNPKSCVAATRTKTVRVPTVPAADRGTQNITSEKLIAKFDGQTQDLEVLEAVGNAKFTELDRNAESDNFVYTAADRTLRLRGGDPNVWDGRSRAKAPEIDWDTGNQVSELRGGASTTYYSQKSTGGATPFGKTDKPVYVTAKAARFDHRTEQAVFTGNARGWQDSNYVSGERLTISQKTGEFVAEENVQSLLYEAKRKENGVETNQPVFVSAQKLTYNRDSRLMRYERDVDIRQGKDRITGGMADIYLTETNEPSRTEIAQNVVITQPNRRAAADFARYETASETVLLKGNPATIDDAEQGRSQGAQFVVNLKENRMTSEGPSKQNSAGRIRSVYKVKTQ